MISFQLDTQSCAAPSGHGGPPGRAGDPLERPYLERASAVQPTRSSGRRRAPETGRGAQRKTWLSFLKTIKSVRTVNRHFIPLSSPPSSLHQFPLDSLTDCKSRDTSHRGPKSRSQIFQQNARKKRSPPVLSGVSQWEAPQLWWTWPPSNQRAGAAREKPITNGQMETSGFRGPGLQKVRETRRKWISATSDAFQTERERDTETARRERERAMTVFPVVEEKTFYLS